ncbi:hypothetical protein ACL6C3_17955 [Capilliphycus salinus ALCB114379]|uniref:hypothetical protein n=1 Tax=Capilliphycus salinus TaxID=2768948 RepID=UPI0039A45DDA
MSEEKKTELENQNPEETFQSRGDPGRDRGPTKATPEPTENPSQEDQSPTSNEKIEPDDSARSDTDPQSS